MMAELLPGQPYTVAEPDTVTQQVSADRTELNPRTFAIQRDYGQNQALIATEVNVQLAALTIPASTLRAGDEVIYRCCALLVNFTGGAITYRLRPKIGSTAYLDRTISVGALSGQTVVIELVMTVRDVTPSSNILLDVALRAYPTAAAGAVYGDSTAPSTPLTLDTTTALAFMTTVVMSSAVSGISTTGQVTSLRVNLA
jgi:hypothetical protein